MPIAMIKGRLKVEHEDAEVSESLINTRERQRALRSKYISGRRVPAKDRKAMETLKRSERYKPHARLEFVWVCSLGACCQ